MRFKMTAAQRQLVRCAKQHLSGLLGVSSEDLEYVGISSEVGETHANGLVSLIYKLNEIEVQARVVRDEQSDTSWANDWAEVTSHDEAELKAEFGRSIADQVSALCDMHEALYERALDGKEPHGVNVGGPLIQHLLRIRHLGEALRTEFAELEAELEMQENADPDRWNRITHHRNRQAWNVGDHRFFGVYQRPSNFADVRWWAASDEEEAAKIRAFLGQEAVSQGLFRAKFLAHGHKEAVVHSNGTKATVWLRWFEFNGKRICLANWTVAWKNEGVERHSFIMVDGDQSTYECFDHFVQPDECEFVYH